MRIRDFAFLPVDFRLLPHAGETYPSRQSALDLVHLGRVIFNSLRVMAALGFTNIDVCFVRNLAGQRLQLRGRTLPALGSCLSRDPLLCSLSLWMTNHQERLHNAH